MDAAANPRRRQFGGGGTVHANTGAGVGRQPRRAKKSKAGNLTLSYYNQYGQCRIIDAKVRDLKDGCWDDAMKARAKTYLRFTVYNEALTDARRRALRHGRSREWREAAAMTPDEARAGLGVEQVRRVRALLKDQHATKKLADHDDWVGGFFPYLVAGNTSGFVANTPINVADLVKEKHDWRRLYEIVPEWVWYTARETRNGGGGGGGEGKFDPSKIGLGLRGTRFRATPAPAGGGGGGGPTAMAPVREQFPVFAAGATQAARARTAERIEQLSQYPCEQLVCMVQRACQPGARATLGAATGGYVPVAIACYVHGPSGATYHLFAAARMAAPVPAPAPAPVPRLPRGSFVAMQQQHQHQHQQRRQQRQQPPCVMDNPSDELQLASPLVISTSLFEVWAW